MPIRVPPATAAAAREPTLTDAHVVRGTVRPEAFLGGRMQIDAGAAARALEPIAQRFGLTLEAAADSAVALANANIVRAIQLISTERGHDPRDYVLVPYGGAGPLHAAKSRRGARHCDDRGAARRGHHLGLWAHRLGLRAVREHDAPGRAPTKAPPMCCARCSVVMRGRALERAGGERPRGAARLRR